MKLYRNNFFLFDKTKDIWYAVPSISSQTFFVQAFKICCRLLKIHCYCYTSYEMTDQFFMISGLNEQLQQQLEYTLLKPDCHSWWISKIQSGHEDTLKERYAIKFCFKLGQKCRHRNVWNASDSFSTISHESSIQWHKRFKEGSESVRNDERCGRSKEFNRPNLIGQRVKVRVTLLRF